MSRSRLTAGAGFLVMAIGIIQVILYGFVPVTALPPALAQVGAIVLLTGVPLLAVVGLWIRQTSVLDRETHLHDLLLGAFVLSGVIQAILISQGTVTIAELGSFSFLALGYFIAGLLGLAGAFALVLGGYVLLHQPGRRDQRLPSLFRVYRMTGLLVSLFIMVAGLEVISQTVAWLGFGSVWATVIPGGAWVIGLVYGRVFTIKALTRLHTDQDRDELYEAFSPETSPLTQLWKLYGLELEDVDEHEARFRAQDGKEVMMRQVEADHPAIREYRTVQGGHAVSRTLLAFDECGDGADVTMETVTDKRIPLVGLPVMLARARFNDIALAAWDFEEEDGFFHVGLGGVEHEF
jgi:hypothetical protein